MQFAEHVLHSRSGVQQGDPLGPLLFAAALQPLTADLRSGSLDMALHFLDDGIIAGDLAAVALSLNLAKCELVVLGPVAPSALSSCLPGALLQQEDGSSRVLQHFEFLGAAIGDDSFVEAHTTKRVAEASKLFDALAALEDPQVGIRLLRACAGYTRTRMIHSMRCNPSCAQASALVAFDELVQRCFSGLTGIHLGVGQWRRATLAFAHAGLGLRSASVHAPAAYLASLGASLSACAELDFSFSADAVLASPAVVQALAALNARLPGNRGLALEKALSSRQHALSEAIDGAAWDAELLAASQTERATLFSEAGAAARAFLAAPPAGKTRMEPAIFLAELRARLGTPEAASEIRCPLCDGVLDVQGHHAAMCVAGGERNQRRNAVRDVVCAWAERAGLHPEKESPASSFMSVRMTHASPSGDQPTSIFRPWPGLQSPLTSLSRRPSDRTPWRRLLGRRRRPLSATPDTRKPTSTRRKPSEGRKRYEEQDRYEESDGRHFWTHIKNMFLHLRLWNYCQNHFIIHYIE